MKPTKTKYVIALEDCEDVFVVKSTPEHILESVPKGKTTYANIISKALGITPRNALMHLVDLEKKDCLLQKTKYLNTSQVQEQKPEFSKDYNSVIIRNN